MILVDTIVLNSEHDGKDSIGMKDSAYTVGGLGAKKLQENGRQQDNLKAAVIDVFLHWSGNDISGQIFHRKMTETTRAREDFIIYGKNAQDVRSSAIRDFRIGHPHYSLTWISPWASRAQWRVCEDNWPILRNLGRNDCRLERLHFLCQQQGEEHYCHHYCNCYHYLKWEWKNSFRHPSSFRKIIDSILILTGTPIKLRIWRPIAHLTNKRYLIPNDLQVLLPNWSGQWHMCKHSTFDLAPKRTQVKFHVISPSVWCDMFMKNEKGMTLKLLGMWLMRTRGGKAKTDASIFMCNTFEQQVRVFAVLWSETEETSVFHF